MTTENLDVSNATHERRGSSRPLTGTHPRIAVASDEPPKDRRRWQDTVAERITGARTCLQHNEKRASTFGAFALVFAAFGSAMIINRLAESDEAATVLRATTMTILCLGAAAGIGVVELGAWLFRDNFRPGCKQWDRLNIVAISLAILGATIWTSNYVRPGSLGDFRFGHGSVGTACAAAALGLVMIALYYNAKTHRDEQDIADLQFEHDLLRHAVRPFQTRAEKLLSVNQIQLRRYYELNLQQARAVFIVGISCIGAGVAVVGLTFWLVSWLSRQPLGGDKLYTQLVVALVGAVGTVLTNYVAHVYFKLHGSITHNLMAFHNQLASTHDLFFANVLASGIDDPDAREDVLLKLTLAIAERKFSGDRSGAVEVKEPAA